MTEEILAKRIVLEEKRKEFEKELGRLCFAIADVDREISDNSDEHCAYLEENKKKPDSHFLGIQKYICALRKIKEEDVKVVSMYEYKKEIEEPLPYGYSSYFNTKAYICSERDRDSLAIVKVEDNTYSIITYFEEPEDLLRSYIKQKYYVVLIKNSDYLA